MPFSDSFQEQHQQHRPNQPQQNQPQHQQHQRQDNSRNQHLPHSNQRRLSNNPFISQQQTPSSNQIPISTPLQPPFAQIRPISVPVDDAFDYTEYDLGPITPSIANFPSGTPLLSRDTVAQWGSPMSVNTRVSAAGPHTPQGSQLRSPTLSSPEESHLHSSQPSLSPVSPVENERKHLRINHSNPASKYTPQTVSRPYSPNDMAMQRKQSFAVNPAHDVIDLDDVRPVNRTKYTLNTEETEEIFENEFEQPQAMKRHRVATQRHVRGRPDNKPKRSKSLFNKKESKSRRGSQLPPTPSLPSFPANEDSNALEARPEHKVFFNMPLPREMVDPESEMPLEVFPRNKVRTTKYTPLSFLPKNLYFQFNNVANVYFLFIVILGVCNVSQRPFTY